MKNVSTSRSAGAPSAVSLSPEDRRGMADFWEVYEERYDEVRAALLASLADDAEIGPVLRSTPREEMDESGRRSRELTRRAILDGDWEPYLEDLRAQGLRYAEAGLSFRAWFTAVGAFRPHILPHLVGAHAGDRPRLQNAIAGMERFIDVALAAVGEAYLQSKEEVIRRQQEAIRELATPVLQVRDRLLILPIVGVIDSRRARQITEQLLRTIRDARAKVVVVDITGVANVDSGVANHLVQTVEASRLMGATVIVTGLSSEISRMLVTLGVDLSKLTTIGDLQGGLEEANRMLGYRVVASDGEAAVREEEEVDA